MTQAIQYEFETEIKDGIIKIPDDYQGNRTGKVKIVILPPEKTMGKLSQALLNAPVWDADDVDAFEKTIQEGYRNWKPETLS